MLQVVDGILKSLQSRERAWNHSNEIPWIGGGGRDSNSPSPDFHWCCRWWILLWRAFGWLRSNERILLMNRRVPFICLWRAGSEQDHGAVRFIEQATLTYFEIPIGVPGTGCGNPGLEWALDLRDNLEMKTRVIPWIGQSIGWSYRLLRALNGVIDRVISRFPFRPFTIPLRGNFS